jgi:hypothetical protein
MAFWRNVTLWPNSGAAVLPMLISLLAVGFTALQWYNGRNQVLLTTRPHLDFDTEYDPDEPPVGIAIINAGPGPALIKSVTFYVDRKSVRDAEEAGLNYAHLTEDELGYNELEPDDTLSVGEKLWLIKYRKPPRGKINPKTLDRFSDFIDQNLAIEVTYCSTVREDLCWTKCSTKGRCR